MLEELQKLLKERNEAYKVYSEKYDAVYARFKDKLLEILPYKDKYVKINSNLYSNPIYLRVDELFEHNNLSGNDKIILRGYGFYSEFTNYADATLVDWSFWKSYDIDVSTIEEDIKAITIITEEEFNKAFMDMVDKMKQEHIEALV